jgi:hypothetical protein
VGVFCCRSFTRLGAQNGPLRSVLELLTGEVVRGDLAQAKGERGAIEQREWGQKDICYVATW